MYGCILQDIHCHENFFKYNLILSLSPYLSSHRNSKTYYMHSHLCSNCKPLQTHLEQLLIYLQSHCHSQNQSQLELGVARVLVDAPLHPTETLRHIKATQEANFQYATLFMLN